MLSKLRKLDVHVKAVDGVNQQTVLGALISLASLVIVSILVLSELSIFMKVDVMSRMVTDTSASLESVQLEIDVSFFHAGCEKISFLQEVTRGTLHIHEVGKVDKTPWNDSGCRVTGKILTDKVGGNFRFGIPFEESADKNNINSANSKNISHIINHIAFVSTKGASAVDKIPGLSNALNRQLTTVPLDSGIYQYSIQVVPTQYKALYGEVSFANQYSVSEKVVSVEQLGRSEALSGLFLRDFRGVIVTYDFHPVMLLMEESREKIIDFVSNLFGIVGGVITVLSLFETLLHQSTKALIGKRD